MAILDVIKYEGDNRTFVWKHPAEDFNTNSQLIVHESQEAHLFLEGRGLDSFGPGRHTLTTQNIPILTSIANLATGGVTPFHAEVWYVNLTEQMGIGWGTSSKVQYMEPTYGFPLSIGASGDMALAVRDGRKLLIKLVGTEVTLSQERLVGYFKSFLQARVKSALAQAMAQPRVSIIRAHVNTSVRDSRLDDAKGRIRASGVVDGNNAVRLNLVPFLVKRDGDDPIRLRINNGTPRAIRHLRVREESHVPAQVHLELIHALPR